MTSYHITNLNSLVGRISEKEVKMYTEAAVMTVKKNIRTKITERQTSLFSLKCLQWSFYLNSVHPRRFQNGSSLNLNLQRKLTTSQVDFTSVIYSWYCLHGFMVLLGIRVSSYTGSSKLEGKECNWYRLWIYRYNVYKLPTILF